MGHERMTAATMEEAQQYNGRAVRLDRMHPNNGASLLELFDGDGSVVDGWIVEDGPKAGAFAVAVDFPTRGMLRAIAADQFILIPRLSLVS